MRQIHPRLLYIVILFTIIYGCSPDNVQQFTSEIKNPKVTAFNLNDIPDSLSGCSCLFSESQEKYQANEFLFFDDIGDNCIISINEQILILQSNGEKYGTGKIKVSIENEIEIGQGYESREIEAELIIEMQNGQIFKQKVYGICGC